MFLGGLILLVAELIIHGKVKGYTGWCDQHVDRLARKIAIDHEIRSQAVAKASEQDCNQNNDQYEDGADYSACTV